MVQKPGQVGMGRCRLAVKVRGNWLGKTSAGELHYDFVGVSMSRNARLSQRDRPDAVDLWLTRAKAIFSAPNS